MAAENNDFRLRPDSPAIKLGFKPFDYTQAGKPTSVMLTKNIPTPPRAFERPKVNE